MQIKKYGGFYIGRYEAGVSVLDKSTNIFIDSVTFVEKNLKGQVLGTTDIHGWGGQNTNYIARNNSIESLLGSTNKANGNVVVKQDSIPYYHADYYTAQEMSKRLYSNNSSITSGLVTGTQWDMMIKYLEDNGVTIQGENCNWGNCDDVAIDGLTGYYTNIDPTSGNTNGFKNCNELENQSTDGTGFTQIILTTGASEKVKKMNLYDVLGNLCEWTEEVSYRYNSKNTSELATNDYNTFMIRGGSYNCNHISLPACSRFYGYAVETSTNMGFRIVLYIK